ncbi:hypothetical protein I203_106577 [Kwoniella mangroviensis CBS 8507]|uniref:uncharacterized protein n=1 Tax=Kwoniella mangroviensis CBS 8507 TaxID=1296122 RepID=UPI00080D4760|nr:uncharacterized protein I203_06926 [Kwoniella mangroviensis CBS 8507]OCF63970.1 hypothetical protein I203_06926 [Kwoniella mangroviensis CBS 8507]
MYPYYHGSSWSTQSSSSQYPNNLHSSLWTSQPSQTEFGISSHSYSGEEEQPPPLLPRPRPAYLGMSSSQGSQQSAIRLQTFRSDVTGSSDYNSKSVYNQEGKRSRRYKNGGGYTPPSMMSYQRPVQSHSGNSSISAHSISKAPHSKHRNTCSSNGTLGKDAREIMGLTATAGILGGMTGGIALSGAEGADERDDREGNPSRNLNLNPGYNPGLNTYSPGGGAGDGDSDGGSDCCGDWCGDGDGCCCCCGDCGDCSGCGEGGGCF